MVDLGAALGYNTNNSGWFGIGLCFKFHFNSQQLVYECAWSLGYWKVKLF